MAALDALEARAGASDTVFIFYAGHGEYGDDGYYLTTHDTRMVGHQVAAGTGIREVELIAKLRAIQAKRLLLIINACHSGEISPVLAPGQEPLTGIPLPSPVAAALLSTGEGRVIISACREQQFSFIGPGPLTLFTQALVDGLQGKGVRSNRGYISVFDLYTHLYFALDEAVPRAVPAVVRQRYGERQEPELTMLKGVGPFAVALYRGATTLGPDLGPGDFDASGSLPEGTAVREVSLAQSQARLRLYQQSVSDHARVGVAVAGDVHGDVNNVTNVTNVERHYRHQTDDRRPVWAAWWGKFRQWQSVRRCPDWRCRWWEHHEDGDHAGRPDHDGQYHEQYGRRDRTRCAEQRAHDHHWWR